QFYPLSLHDALPIYEECLMRQARFLAVFIFSCTLLPLAKTQTSTACPAATAQSYRPLHSFATNGQGPNDPRYSGIIAQGRDGNRSEEHTSELQSLAY